MTITATEGGSTFNGITLRVKVLTGVAASQAGAGSHATDLPVSAAYQTSVTTTQTGSLVYGAGVRGSVSAPAVLGNTTAIDTVNDATNSYGRDTFRTTSATGAPGATAVGYSTSEVGGIAALEILPNGTITEDASSPAVATTNTATTVTTASFTPPAGSLLVAMVSSGGNTGSVTMTVSGGGLAWAEAVKTNAAGDDYAGVWTASVPAAAAASSPGPIRRPRRRPRPRSRVTLAPAVPAPPAPAPFPQSPLGLQAEISLPMGWAPITSYVYQRDGDTPVAITRGRPDEAAQTEPSQAAFQLNNRDGRFTVLNPSGAWYGQVSRNTPVRFSLPAAGRYLRMEDDTASYASTPDSPALSVTGDLEVQIDLQLSGWIKSALASKWDDVSGSQRAWFLELQADGTPALFWSPDGSAVVSAASNVPLPLGRVALKATLAAATGTVTFYTAPTIAGSWTQLGTATSGTLGAATSVFDSTAPLAVGYDANLTSGTPGPTGRLFAFRLLNGIGGPAVASPDFTAPAQGMASFPDGQGNTWTLHGTAYICDRDFRFHGELSSLPTTWDPTGTDVWTPVTAAGLLRRLGQGNAPVYSALTRGNLNLAGTLAAHAFWPCEDGQGSTSIGSAIGGPAITIAGTAAFAGDSAFTCTNPIPTINSSTWTGAVPAYTSNGSLVVRFLLDVTSAPAANSVFVSADTNGTAQWIGVYAGGTNTNSFGIVGYDKTGAALFNPGAFTFAGLPVSPTYGWFSIELTPGAGGTVNYQLVYLQPGQATGFILFSGSYSGTIGNCADIQVNPFGAAMSAGLGQITVQSGISSIYSLYQQLNAWQGETAGSRFSRLCTENGLASRIYGPPGRSAPMGAQTPQDLPTLLRECEEADQGMIFEPRQVLALGYRTQGALCSQPAAVTLDYSAAELGGDGSALQPTYDDQYTRNDVIAQRSGGTGATSGASARATLADGSAMSTGAPPAGAGEYSTSVSVNVQADTQLPDAAAWRVHLGTVNEQRWPHVPVNMARSAVAAVQAAVQACDIGDYLQIANPPAWLAPDTIRQLIAGYQEILGGYHWRLAFHCMPESPYETGIYDDATYGRADTDGSTLAAAVTSAAVTLSVASAGIVWTTVAADFPFDIAIGGERITVTNITGASSPQSFTVTRSVNSVVKAHSSGDDVRLWFPPVYGLS